MIFRIYLTDASANLVASECFIAHNDVEASAIAKFVYQACSDEFPGYELWRGPHQIAGCPPHYCEFRHNSEKSVQKHLDCIVDLVERLLTTFQGVQRSRRLAIQMKRLRLHVLSLMFFHAMACSDLLLKFA